jgi:hypothetical protein
VPGCRRGDLRTVNKRRAPLGDRRRARKAQLSAAARSSGGRCTRRLQRSAGAAAGSRCCRDRAVHARRRLAALQPRPRRHAVLAAAADFPHERRRAAASLVVSARPYEHRGARRVWADAARHRRCPLRDGCRSRRRVARRHGRRGVAIPSGGSGAVAARPRVPARRRRDRRTHLRERRRCSRIS